MSHNSTCVLLWRQRQESPMDHGQLSMIADKFQWVFSEALLYLCTCVSERG
jgi:hypothetical protein